MPDVSVIIVNYNTVDLTKGCIKSINEKTQGLTYEIIVVDNASSEGTEGLDEQPIELVKSDKNLGFAGGNNLGISHASGDYILLLNSDTVLENDAISIVWEYLRSKPNMGAASSLLRYPNGKLQHVCQRFPSAKYIAIELFRLQKFWSKSKAARVLKGAFFDHKTETTTDWVWGTFFMFKKSILDEFPGKKLSDDFFMYGEDMQWCMELKRIGYAIGYQPAAKVVHYMGGSSGKKEKWMKENNETFLKLYYPWYQIWLIHLLTKLLLLTLRRP